MLMSPCAVLWKPVQVIPDQIVSLLLAHLSKRRVHDAHSDGNRDLAIQVDDRVRVFRFILAKDRNHLFKYVVRRTSENLDWHVKSSHLPTG